MQADDSLEHFLRARRRDEPARSVVMVSFEGSAAAPLELPRRTPVVLGCILRVWRGVPALRMDMGPAI